MRVNFITDTELLKMMVVGGPQSAVKNLSKALKMNGVEVDINGSGKYDIVHIHTLGPLAIEALVNKKAKTIMHAHVTSGDMIGYLEFAEFTFPFIDGYLSLIYNSADALICPTEFTKKKLSEIWINKDIKVLSNGVDLEKFKYDKKAAEDFRKTYKIGKKEKIIYAVGQVVPRKGLHTFLEMAKKFPEHRFVWVGNRKWGFLQKSFTEVENLIKNPPKNVIFTGYVDSVIGVHSAGNIFLFPSFYENQGIVTLEAAACGSSLLLRDIPVYKGWLTSGKNAFLANNDDEFEKYLKIMLKKENKFSKETMKMVKKHDLKRIGKKLVSFYKDILGSVKK